ncbi:hypothetical protein H6A07_08310 [Olsenella uli]|uniref:hypothetical protein n=1 Tax=Olsenella uli TaxID=133926 RepID=UPI00195B28DF|nr:hypothetical protein [Olsenella uli]MBM6676744.1 hypothetical protein [Olsenella uli]
MDLTFDRLSALRALRVFRAGRRPLSAERHDLTPPDPSPRQRWTPGLVPYEALALESPPSVTSPVEILAPSLETRARGGFFSCLVRSSTLPDGSFVDLGEGISIPCPELLFLELADVMQPAVHALLGYELCGTYARSAADPRLGEVTYDVPPVTSVNRIGAYLDRVGRRRSVLLARRNLGFVRDNAWSPMEAIVALVACMGPDDLGYGFGDVDLNVRHGLTPELVSLGCRGSRVPDIELRGLHVGFNYDGHDHLDLASVVSAPTSEDAWHAAEQVREKYLDDLRRNRELAATGWWILPVTSEDLFAPGGLDAVMLLAATAAQELVGGTVLQDVRAAVARSRGGRRQQLIWSLLPWPPGARYAHELAAWRPWEHLVAVQ